MKTLRIPPLITVHKSAAYALYELSHIRDVAYKPQEYYVKSRKCEPYAGGNVLKICESQPVVLVGLNGEYPHHVEIFLSVDKMMKGKDNTAHCVRFPGDCV